LQEKKEKENIYHEVVCCSHTLRKYPVSMQLVHTNSGCSNSSQYSTTRAITVSSYKCHNWCICCECI